MCPAHGINQRIDRRSSGYQPELVVILVNAIVGRLQFQGPGLIPLHLIPNVKKGGNGVNAGQVVPANLLRDLWSRG